MGVAHFEPKPEKPTEKILKYLNRKGIGKFIEFEFMIQELNPNYFITSRQNQAKIIRTIRIANGKLEDLGLVDVDRRNAGIKEYPEATKVFTCINQAGVDLLKKHKNS